MQQVGRRCGESFAQLVSLDGLHSTGEVALAYRTITDYDNVLQNGLVVFQRHVQRGRCLDGCSLVTNVADSNVSTLIGLQREVTVEVGDGSVLCVRYTYGGSDDGFTLSIFHMAFDVDLCKGSHR